jgi:hypothetical protein
LFKLYQLGFTSTEGEWRTTISVVEKEGREKNNDEATNLNSLLRARMASLARVSLAEALSHTSRTRAQSLDVVAVRYPVMVID